MSRTTGDAGIDRRLSKYRSNETILKAITRHANPIIANDTPLPSASREAPDRTQVIGIPLFIQRTPPWRRQDWAEPQTRPIVGRITLDELA